MLLTVALFIIGMTAGMAVGSLLANAKWSWNAYEPKRLLYDGKFYKVLEIGSAKSLRMMDIHKNQS